MKRIIDIPGEVLESKHYCQYFGAWSTKLTELIEQSKPYDDSGDLISREALLKAIREYAEPSSKLSDDLSRGITECACEVLDIIDNAPPVEPICPYLSDQEVKQPCIDSPCLSPKGEWINREAVSNTIFPFWERYECNQCHKFNGYSNFCPNCGADMRTKESDNETDN